MVKREGKPNDLLNRIEGQAFFKPIIPELKALIDPATFTGRSADIVAQVVSKKVEPALERYQAALQTAAEFELKV